MLYLPKIVALSLRDRDIHTVQDLVLAQLSRLAGISAVGRLSDRDVAVLIRMLRSRDAVVHCPTGRARHRPRAPLDRLGLSQASISQLHRHGIAGIEDLASCTLGQLAGMDRLSPRRAAEVLLRLHEFISPYPDDGATAPAAVGSDSHGREGLH